MLRAAAPSGRNLLRARTLTNRKHRDRRDRKARLRLDNLEAREQPGSVLTGLAVGLAGGTMLEPLQVIGAVLGDVALPRVTPPTAPSTPAAPAPSTSAGTDAGKNQDSSTVTAPAEAGGVLGPTPGGRPPLRFPANLEDPPALSIAGGPPPGKAPPALPEAGGGSGGGAATPRASHLAGEALPSSPPAPASGANHEEGPALSLPDVPSAGPVSPAVSPSLAGSTHQTPLRAPRHTRRHPKRYTTPPHR